MFSLPDQGKVGGGEGCPCSYSAGPVCRTAGEEMQGCSARFGLLPAELLMNNVAGAIEILQLVTTTAAAAPLLHTHTHTHIHTHPECLSD